MTRNLYLGAELGSIIGALATGNQSAIIQAATQTWLSVQATDPPERMAAIADEIVEARPAVVGLQEVTRWTTYDFDPATGALSNPQVAYDFLDLLLAALAERGVHYEVVTGATADNFSSAPIPILAGEAFPTKAVQLEDRDVILRRSDVQVSNAQNGNFDAIIEFPLPGGTTLEVDRGWGSVDVRTKHAEFRFVNAHLEAFGIPGVVDAEDLRVAQVRELLLAQATVAAEHGDLPTVYVGDYNSDAPDAPAYRLLVSSVGLDAWVVSNPRDAGLTCCFDALVTDETATLDSRIDLVLVEEEVQVLRSYVIGEELGDMTNSGLWPSDHAGVVARLLFDRPSKPHLHHR